MCVMVSYSLDVASTFCLLFMLISRAGFFFFSDSPITCWLFYLFIERKKGGKEEGRKEINENRTDG